MSPPFELPWSVLFWTAWLWSFFASEAGVAKNAHWVPNPNQPATRDNLRLFVLVILLGQAVGLGLSWFRVAMLTRPWLFVAFALGIGLMLGGSLLRRRCFKLLGERFTYDVRATEEQELVTVGPYRLVRHPSYLGGLMMIVGAGLATGSYATVAVTAAMGGLLYAWRIRVEEAYLCRVIGDRYQAYATGRKRLIPYLY